MGKPTTLVFVVSALLALVFLAHAARSPATITVDVDLPSSSTGLPNGKLAVRISAPATPAAARYADGAPVVIWLPGGDTAGSLPAAVPRAADVIRIVFLFPGGVDRASGRRSNGSYDHRGANCIAALRDVILYAAGQLTDADGQTIDERLPVPVLHDNIGLLGVSNGGNIVVAVAATHGAQLAAHLRYVIQWESPVSSQIATLDAGGVNLDCPGNRRERLDAFNPRYRGCGPLALDIDYTDLAYQPADPHHPVFWDGNRDGRYTTVIDPSSGCGTPDLNGDGALGLDEDFPLAASTDGIKRIYSRPATHALASQQTFGGSWPADVATVAEANAYWGQREAVRLAATAQDNVPGLEWMVLASVQDHVQAAPDKPHVRQAFEGHPWVKLNPAHPYVVEVDPSLSGRNDLPDTAANVPPGDWSDAASYAYPDGLEETYYAAAVHEMADRAHARLVRSTPTAPPTSPPTATPPGVREAYLMAFHACTMTGANCSDPRNHQVYLAQSRDGVNWSLLPAWAPYGGSVPDVIRRGDTLYLYTPGELRRYRFRTDTWQTPTPVTISDPEAPGGYVDPSLCVDEKGRLVLFYLPGVPGQNPAACAPGEATCVKHIHSAIEVEGSDGAAFIAAPGDRLRITISASDPASASDPDVFHDGSRYVLYLSRGANVQVSTSPTLHGEYTLSTSLPDGYLVHGGAVPCGHYDAATARYWTYVHTEEGVIRRAVHASLDVPLTASDFTTVLTGSSLGLGASYRVESPGFALGLPSRVRRRLGRGTAPFAVLQNYPAPLFLPRRAAQ